MQVHAGWIWKGLSDPLDNLVTVQRQVQLTRLHLALGILLWRRLS